MNKDEIKRVAEIDRSEVIEYIYYFHKSGLKLEKEFWNVEKWNSEQKLHHISSLQDIYDRGGTIFEAFYGSKIIGVIALDNEFIGRNKNQLNLAGLWVSKQYRKMGVGKALVELVKNKAREIGAEKLYVSTTPSQNTVKFYMNRGFRLAKEINKKLFEMEPEDIHMELIL
ncbi:MAG: GNAT family N-acetyltransferase [Candidatus Hodarchaeales archaeon]|jgi:predicted N-acetyltransferase YhbS